MKFSEFEPELALLSDLLRSNLSNELIVRLEDIFTTTELLWEENSKRLKGTSVKYILICEAPPWTDEGQEPKYIYNYKIPCSRLLTIIHKSFAGDYRQSNKSVLEKLVDIAHAGMLLIDSLPFAIDYSSSNRRSSKFYRALLKESIPKYMLRKMSESQLAIDTDVKIAFGFKKNARTIIDLYPDGLFIEKIDKTLSFHEDLICTGKSNFAPDRKLMKRIFELDSISEE